MGECSAQTRGHFPGSRAERECSEHGHKPSRVPAALHCAPESSETAKLVDRDGGIVVVTKGVIDQAAINAYTAGQCIVLAIELAEAIGSNRIAVLASYPERADGAKYSPDIHHAWALSPNGTVGFDIQESQTVAFLRVAAMVHSKTKHKAELHCLATDEARRVMSARAPEQDFETAASFVEPLLRQRPEMLQDEAFSAGDMRFKEDGTVEVFVNGEWYA